MENNISIKDNNSYINMLINQTFSILPLYEENGKCELLTQKINNVYHRLNGFFKMNSFGSDITIDILSFVNKLKDSDSHKEIRFCVLKVCSLLSCLKVVDE
uniref:hypothetical protein n=1 Tax=Agathobacter sp. TaxID=2021311 RepID=UPI004056F267